MSGRLPEPEARQDEIEERLAAVPADIPRNGMPVSAAAPPRLAGGCPRAYNRAMTEDGEARGESFDDIAAMSFEQAMAEQEVSDLYAGGNELVYHSTEQARAISGNATRNAATQPETKTRTRALITGRPSSTGWATRPPRSTRILPPRRADY